MYSVNGQGSWNFFKNDFSNHIPDATGVALTLLAQKFSTATPWIQTIGLKPLAEWTQKGENRGENTTYPFKLVFRPHHAVSTLFTDDFTSYFTDQLKTIRPNTPIYEVYAQGNPGDQLVRMGSITSVTEFVTSRWGDESLFFQHNKMEVDLGENREWEHSTPKFKCPFDKFMGK